MGAVPVLIMLAAVGVDYGWQPDGTTSRQGDNVEYIIQIPPQQLDQIRSAGEITSAIDPSIQGRVSRVVIKIGNGPLPKDSGRSIAEPEAATGPDSAAPADDTAQIPIPEITADSLAQAAAQRAASPGSESLMKPDPQAGGYTLPDSMSNPVRTNPAVSTDPAASGRDNRWGDLSGRSSNAAASPSSPSGAAANSFGAPPSTDPATRPTSSAWPSFAPQTTTSNTAAATSASAPSTAQATSPAGGDSFATTNAGNTAASGNRPLSPNDPNWSGYGTTPNFGTMPPGISPPPGIVRSQSGSTSPAGTDYASQDAANQRAASGASTNYSGDSNQDFGRDAAGNPLDRLGRPLNSQGQVFDPETGHRVDGSGNWIDPYGRPIDRLGRLLPREPGTSSGQSGTASLQAPLYPAQQPRAADEAPGGYAQPGYGQPPYAPPAQSAAPSYANSGYPSIGYPSSGQLVPQTAWAQGPPAAAAPTSPPWAQPVQYSQPPIGGDPRLANGNARSNTGSNQTGSNQEDSFRSPSDSRSGADPRGDLAERPTDRDPSNATLTSASRSRTVAAQPFFNFVLLISLVGNAYLIYETGNLRRKFRNMIANVRASKLSAQPAG